MSQAHDEKCAKQMTVFRRFRVKEPGHQKKTKTKRYTSFVARVIQYIRVGSIRLEIGGLERFASTLLPSIHNNTRMYHLLLLWPTQNKPAKSPLRVNIFESCSIYINRMLHFIFNGKYYA